MKEITMRITMPGYTIDELLQLPDKGFWNYWTSVAAQAKYLARRGRLTPEIHEAMSRIAQAVRLGYFSGYRRFDGLPLTAHKAREACEVFNEAIRLHNKQRHDPQGAEQATHDESILNLFR